MAVTYDLAGAHFSSQAELERAVKAILKTVPRDEVFGVPLLTAIVNTLHPEVIKAGQHSDGRFQLLTWRKQAKMGLQTAQDFRGGELMISYFQPLNRWQDVTVYPWKRPSNTQRLKDALRLKASKIIPHPTASTRCESMGCTCRGYDLEYHHVSPTFQTILQECLTLFSPEEVSDLFGYNKFRAGTFTLADFIPDSHLAVKRMGELHRNAEFQWLCVYHHGLATKAQREEV